VTLTDVRLGQGLFGSQHDRRDQQDPHNHQPPQAGSQPLDPQAHRGEQDGAGGTRLPAAGQTSLEPVRGQGSRETGRGHGIDCGVIQVYS